MKIKRSVILSLILLLFISLLSFSACSSGEEPNGDLEESKTGIVYRLSENGEYYILQSSGSCTLTEIEIPSTYKGKPIKEIAENAFNRNNYVTKVVFGKNVEVVNSFAFSECENLTTLQLNDGVKTIKFQPAIYCEKLNYEKQNGLSYLGSDTNKFLFLDSADQEITEAFINENCKIISQYAFGLCSELQAISFPKGVTEICEGLLSDLEKIISIEVDENNPNYKSVNDVLYTKDGKNLVQYAVAKSDGAFTVPFGVKKICMGAFSKANNLTHVTMPTGVEVIGNYAFSGCEKLETVTLSNDIVTIGDTAFAWSALTTVTIPEGTQQIGFRAFAYCEDLRSVTIGGKTKIQNVQTVVGERAFESSRKIKELTIGVNVVEFKDWSLYECEITSVKYLGSIADFFKLSFGYYSNPLSSGGGLYIDEKLLTNFVVPYGVTEIPGLFSSYEKFTSVTLPVTVKKIESSVFKSSKNLTTVYYQGGLEEWCDIEFGDQYANPMSANTTVYFNDQQFGYSLEIPSTVTKISDYAFSKYPLTSVKIHNGVLCLGEGVFKNCLDLQTLELGESVKSIGKDAFLYCSKLSTINYTANVDKWCDIDFENGKANPLSTGATLYVDGTVLTELELSNTVTKIKPFALYNCDTLTKLTMHNAITEIGESAFDDCSNLQNVVLSENLTKIGYHAFNNCNNLAYNTKDNIDYLGGTENKYLFLVKASSTDITAINIDQGCTFIGENAFNNCKQVTEFVLTENVLSVGKGVLSNCISIQSVTISKVGGNEEGQTHFGYLFGTENYYVPESLKRVVITGETKIADLAFFNCQYIEEIVLNDEITAIGYAAFDCCFALRSITLPNELKEIGGQAFGTCSSLEEITIPSKVVKIGSLAFNGCDALESIVFIDTENWYLKRYTDIEQETTENIKIDVTNSLANAQSFVCVLDCAGWFKGNE